jgi:hypothetical protein
VKRLRQLELASAGLNKLVYRWRAKFDGMEASDAKRLKDIKSENSKLKQLLAGAHP